MLILRRISMWVVETASSAAFIGLWFRLYEGAPLSLGQPFLVQWWNYTQMTVVVFMLGSGYFLTTAIGAISRLRNQAIWLYPAATAALFVIHLWLFSGRWKSPSVLLLYVVGLIVVFACALFGNMVLRRNDAAA